MTIDVAPSNRDTAERSLVARWRDTLSEDDAVTINDRIREVAETFPRALAILAPDRPPLSYEGLVRQFETVRRSLNAQGFGRGNRIATVLPNDADMAVAMLGIMDGATAVPLNPDLTEHELNEYLARAKADAVIVECVGGDPARRAAADLGIAVIELAPGSKESTGAFDLRAQSDRTPSRSRPAHWRDIAQVLMTTGTTSDAKVVPLNHLNITDRSLRNCRWLSLGPADRCLQFMPLYHGQGANIGLIAPLLVGGSTILWPQFDASAFFAMVEEFDPTWYTAGPTHHRAVLAEADRHADCIARSRIRFIRSGSAHLPHAISAAVAQVFGVPVIESYNTSEAGTLAIASLEDDKRKAGTVGLAVEGNVAILDGDGNLLGDGEVGEVVTRGPSVFGGYEGSQEMNDSSFAGGWLRTGDLGRIDADGYLSLSGRLKELINRGGEKIPPTEVEEALLAAPGVGEVAVFPIPHKTLNEEIAAAVILGRGATATERSLQRFVRNRLAPFKIPRRIVFVDEIPKEPNGKVRRIDLAKRLGLVGRNGPEQTADSQSRSPRSDTERALAKIWADQLGLDQVNLDDDFFLLGGDSLQAMQILRRIERRFAKTLPRAALLDASTIAELARLVESEDPFSCLVLMQPDGDAPPFFCLHDGFGHVLNFRHLARLLGTDQPFYGVQAVGTDGRGDLNLTIEEMALGYIDDILRVQPHGPYYLGGYSFGGKIALELAHLLQTRGEEVALLALLDSSASGVKTRAPLSFWLKTHIERFSELSLVDKIAYLRRRFRNAADLVQIEIRQQMLRYALRRLRQGRRLPYRYLHDVSIRATRRYRHKIYDGHTVLFRAQTRAFTGPEVHRAWDRYVKGGVQIRPIPGEHHTIIDEPFVQGLAKELREALADAREGAEPLRPHPVDTDRQKDR